MLAAGAGRTENRLVFAILALSSGSTAARGVRTFHDFFSETAIILGNFTFSAEWGISFLVLALALVYPRSVIRSPRAKAAYAAGLVTAVALWVTVVLRKDLVYVVLEDGRWGSETWASLVLDDLRYYVAMLIALGLFARAHIHRPPDSPDRRGALLLTAFALGPIASVPYLLKRVAQALVDPVGPIPVIGARIALNAVGALLIIGLVAWGAWAGHRRGHSPWFIAIWSGAAFVVGAGTFLLSGLFPTSYLLGTHGDFIYLLLRPVLLGYAVLRFQLFDADVRVKHGFASTLLVLVVCAVFLPVEEIVRRFSGLPSDMALSAGIAAGLGVTLALYTRLHGFVEGTSNVLFRRVREEDTRWMEERKRELYRVALERAFDHTGSLTPHADEDLASMRRRLGVGDGEHAALVQEVREATVKRMERERGTRPAEPGTHLLSRYLVEDVLGEGGSGRTYRCRDERLDREVAVKEIHARSPAEDRVQERALKEARRLARIRHPCVVTLHEIHEVGARAFLVMELVESGSLADRLRERPRVPVNEAARVLSDILDGLAALHDADLVHRDVKPSNVLMTRDGRAKLADLGVARDAAMMTVTGLGARAGTPAYMAPEQVLDLPVDARTDVYAAGVLFYEMLTGENPVRKAVRAGVLVEEAIVSRAAPLPAPGAPEWANAFLARALAKAPEKRFADAREAGGFVRAATAGAEPAA